MAAQISALPGGSTAARKWWSGEDWWRLV